MQSQAQLRIEGKIISEIMSDETKILKMAKLALLLAGLYLFAFVLLPLGAEIPLLRKVLEHNEKLGIQPQTLFYSETPLFQEADNFMKNSRKFPSKDKKINE